jgi:hypothetical protein
MRIYGLLTVASKVEETILTGRRMIRAEDTLLTWLLALLLQQQQQQ